MKTIIASCGQEICEDENFVCPYISGKKELDRKYCGINYQLVTNICMDSMDFDSDE